MSGGNSLNVTEMLDFKTKRQKLRNVSVVTNLTSLECVKLYWAQPLTDSKTDLLHQMS